MTDVRAELAERRAAEEDRVRQERAGAPGGLRSVNRTAPGYVHAVSPETGDPVVFVPGEALPDWAVEALDAGKSTRHEQTGVIVLNVPPGKSRR